MVDFDNFQKWLAWFKNKPAYKIWLSLPLILIPAVFWLAAKLIEQREKNLKIREEVSPIRELYPKLELSVAVAKLIEDYKVLNNEVAKFKALEDAKPFRPLTNNIKQALMKNLQSIRQDNTELEFEFFYVNPSREYFKKIMELVSLFKDARLSVSHSNTIMSANQNIALQYHPDLNSKTLNKIGAAIKTVVVIDRVPAAKETFPNKNKVRVIFLGIPLFDEEGRMFFN